MDLIGLYCDMVIRPLDEYVKELRAKVYSKNFFDWLSRNLYKEYLEKAEVMLIEKYKHLEELIAEELDEVKY